MWPTLTKTVMFMIDVAMCAAVCILSACILVWSIEGCAIGGIAALFIIPAIIAWSCVTSMRSLWFWLPGALPVAFWGICYVLARREIAHAGSTEGAAEMAWLALCTTFAGTIGTYLWLEGRVRYAQRARRH
jgi:hypothetical protein